jgi:hypothetical protein
MIAEVQDLTNRLNNLFPEQLSSIENFTNNLVSSAIPSQLHYNTNFTAIADTGASHHYCHTNAPVPQRNYNALPTVFGLANGNTCTSIAKATLDLPDLPPGTASCHIMPSFVNNLLSMDVFCDADCSVPFTKHTATVTNKAGKVILTGFRKTTGAKMWRFNLQPPWHPFQKTPLACNATPPQIHQSYIIPDNNYDFIKNISWNMNIKYTGESEQAIVNNLADALGASSKKDDTYSEDSYRGMFDTLMKQLSRNNSSTGPAGPPGTHGPAGTHGSAGHAGTHGSAGNYGTAANLKPSTLDWKERSQQICDQLNKRGLKPYDFGCIDIKTVGDNFSFRGYAKMICNRISTMYDPSIPELCGCPPPTWPGWRP